MNDKSKDNEYIEPDDVYRKRAEEERLKRIKRFSEALLDESAKGELATADVAAVAAYERTGESDSRVGGLIKGLGEIVGRDHSGHRKRLRERLSVAGDLDPVSDEELLEAFLAYLIPRKDVAPLAVNLLERYGSLWKVLNAKPSELKRFSTMTERAARIISHVARLAKDCGVKDMSLQNRARALEFFASLNAGDREVKTHVAYLDADYKIIDVETFRGDSPVDFALVVAGAYRRSARAVIIGRRESMLLPQWQNGADYAIKLRDLLDTIGVALLDNMVFTGLGYYSLGANVPRNDSPIIYTFTPLLTIPDIGALLHRMTPEDEEQF